MTQIRQMVLDPQGLPMVLASRSEEGNVKIEQVKRHNGGMLVLEALTEPAHRATQVDDDQEALSIETQMQRAQIALARSLGDQIEEERRTVDEMQSEIEAVTENAAAERLRAEQLARENEELKAQLQAKPATRGPGRPKNQTPA